MKMSDLIIQLPSEIWSKICEYLDNYSKTLLLRSSKLFRFFLFENYYLKIKDIYKLDSSSFRYQNVTQLEINDQELNKEYLFTDKIILKNINNLAVYGKKNISSSFAKKFYDLIYNQNNLQRLKVANLSNISFSDNLTILEIYDCNLPKDQKLPDKLKKLIYSISNPNGEFIQSIKLPESLEELEVINNSKIMLSLPILSDNLKILKLNLFILPEVLPKNLEELTIDGAIKFFLLIEHSLAHQSIDYFSLLKKLFIRTNVIQTSTLCMKIMINSISRSKLEELEIQSSWIENIKLPETLISLTLLNHFPNEMKLNLNNLKFLRINFISYNNNIFNSKIIAENLEKLVLSGNYDLKKEQLIVPKLKELILINFIGIISIPESIIKSKNKYIYGNQNFGRFMKENKDLLFITEYNYSNSFGKINLPHLFTKNK